ncbi:MAG: dimethyl sulfoxide reductase anchor subunit [Pseudomonadota bacterium]|nr:dimethyl sulfoxide reductase anchor subunit [Pseudomonadota bacterium]
MNPAFSVIVFTTVAGAAQGLVVALAFAVLGGLDPGVAFLGRALLVAAALLVVGLAASFLHLGRPERAWRAAMMWRTSWLSREVIVLPAFIGVVALWWLALRIASPGLLANLLLPLAAIAVGSALWYCTAMIYACLRFIEEWSHPLTLVNFVLIGLASGLLLASALGAVSGANAFVHATGPAALVATLSAWAGRTLALRRNASIRHRSTLQSATGIQAPLLVQKSMGMSAGSFNTREFFHSASAAGLKRIRLALFVLGFALPSLLAAWAIASQASWPWWCAVLVQAPGLVADRWFFFAQAKHPQNLYYQVVS